MIQSLNIVRALITAALLTASSSFSQAALVDVDGDFGLDTIHDTVSGLDWLDLSVTAGDTVNQVNSALVGGFLAGWRRADHGEICGLAQAHAGASDPTCTGFEPMDLSASVSLAQLLGAPSESSSGFSFSALSTLQNTDVGDNRDEYFAFQFIINVDHGFAELDSQVITVERDIPGFNHFLVRATPVPVPAAVLLLASGLVTIFSIRHKTPT